MAVYYLDTSALVKAYVTELGSPWVSGLINPLAEHDLYTVRLTGPEMIAALYRKVRTGAITVASAAQAATNFNRDWQQGYQIVEIHTWTSDQAMVLAAQHIVRGYDAVHLAAALDVNRYYQAQSQPPLTFVSADIEQLRVATMLGLLIENPDQHP